MLHSIPIYAVMVEDLGERGAQYTALRLLQHDCRTSSVSRIVASSSRIAASGAAAFAAIAALQLLQHDCRTSSLSGAAAIAAIAAATTVANANIAAVGCCPAMSRNSDSCSSEGKCSKSAGGGCCVVRHAFIASFVVAAAVGGFALARKWKA
jgi:hypothetical protein